MKPKNKTCSACGEEYPKDVLFCPIDGSPLSTSKTQSPKDDDSYLGMELPGQLRIDSLLGIGSMGRVYRAFQAGIERDVAVKVLHRELSSNQQLVARFHREAKIASRLVHPNVVQVLMTGTLPFCSDPRVGGELYLVMEYLDGISLLSAMAAAGGDEASQALALPRALHIALQICDAVGEAHAQGITHRDIKPENVMLVRRGEDTDFVKVLDFGIARMEWGDRSMATQAGLIFGTAKYISPEGAEGKVVGPSADVYAIATILYQLLAGRAPFEGDSPVALLVQHTSTPPPDIRSIARSSYVPEPIAQLIMQNLSKQASSRASNARELGRELMAAARASGLSPEAVAQSSMIPKGRGALALSSKQRTKELDLSADVVDQITRARRGRADQQVADAGTISTPPPGTGADSETTQPGAPLDPSLLSKPPHATTLDSDAPISSRRARRSVSGRRRTSSIPGRRMGTSRHSSPDSAGGDASSTSLMGRAGGDLDFEDNRQNWSSGQVEEPRAYDETMLGHEAPSLPLEQRRRWVRWTGVVALMACAVVTGLVGGHYLIRDSSATKSRDSVEGAVAAAREAMHRGAWQSPSPDNVQDITVDASERWPADPRVLALRREASERCIAEALEKKYSGRPEEAKTFARLALELSPEMTTAQHFLRELSTTAQGETPIVSPTVEEDAPERPIKRPALGPRGPAASATGQSTAGASSAKPAASAGAVSSATPAAPPEPTDGDPAALPPPPPALPADHQPSSGNNGEGPWL